MKIAARLLLLALCCGITLGCRKTAPRSTTGARAVVTEYFGALAKGDWAAAYALLDEESQRRVDGAAFAALAEAYCKHVGFPIGKVHIRSCDEQGDKAIAQIALTDAAGSANHRYREGAVLAKEAGGWRIVLPANFGAQ